MTLIKWPGGKTREIKEFEQYIPEFDRYIEPFFGGGAVFFHLQPKEAMINDISKNLMDFYEMVKEQNRTFKTYLNLYDESFKYYIGVATKSIDKLKLYYNEDLVFKISEIEELFPKIYDQIILDPDEFYMYLTNSINDKIKRTHRNSSRHPMPLEDIEKNLITGIASGYYLYFRNLYNKMQLDTLMCEATPPHRVANFYWIREYCYGSMFRYNKQGEFNIPYGGISYNDKNFKRKIDKIFSEDISNLFLNTSLYNSDFEDFIKKIDVDENDFMFIDPPYDTEFSTYDNNSFDKQDQIRLRDYLAKTPAKFIMVIKNTEFIYNLYNSEQFQFLNFNKQYTYNVRSRNNRDANHLIITNYL